MAMAGESGLLRKDCSALRIPYLPRTETAAPQPPDLELPLYSYQVTSSENQPLHPNFKANIERKAVAGGDWAVLARRPCVYA